MIDVYEKLLSLKTLQQNVDLKLVKKYNAVKNFTGKKTAILFKGKFVNKQSITFVTEEKEDRILCYIKIHTCDNQDILIKNEKEITIDRKNNQLIINLVY